MPSVVLITGVSRFLGARVAAQLAADPAVERMIGIDMMPPRTADRSLLGRTEFVRADIRNPLIAKVMTQARVTVVVHAALMSSPRAAGGRIAMQELNVVGTMQLLAAAQKSDTVERIVVRSTTAVYGSGPRDPAVFTEDMHPDEASQHGFAKDAVEMEGYVRGLRRRRPDIDVSVLRMAPVIGPNIDNAITRYLAMPIVPTVLGFDPRLQLVHEADAVEVLRLATVARHSGAVNVAGAGTVTLSQALRRAGRVRVPVPAARFGLAATLVRNSGALDLAAEDVRYLSFGRVVDTSRLRAELGYLPRYSTAQALDSYLVEGPSGPGFTAAGLGVASRLLQPRRGQRRPAIS